MGHVKCMKICYRVLFFTIAINDVPTTPIPNLMSSQSPPSFSTTPKELWRFACNSIKITS